MELLVLLLALFSGLGATARGFGFRFLLGRVTLGVRLILLGLALFDNIVATSQRSANLFGLALNALDDSLNPFFCTAIVIAHSSILSLAVVSSALFGCESV
jgi:hypothetical protein